VHEDLGVRREPRSTHVCTSQLTSPTSDSEPTLRLSLVPLVTGLKVVLPLKQSSSLTAPDGHPIR